jgi:hypothetical protein
MEESLFEKIPQLEKLLETKSFSELSSMEKEAVTKHMKQDEYDVYHEIILKSKNRFAYENKTITPDPTILNRLLEKMENKRSRRTGVFDMFHKLITFRIPVYQPAFAVTIIAVLFFILNNRSHETIRYLARNDTIYLEKQIPALPSKMNPSLKVVTMPAASMGKTDSEKPIHTELTNEHIINTHNDHYVENAYQKIRLVTLFKHGHSALEDSALIRLLIAAN